MAGINSKSIYLVHIAVFAVSDKKAVKAVLHFRWNGMGPAQKCFLGRCFTCVNLYSEWSHKTYNWKPAVALILNDF